MPTSIEAALKLPPGDRYIENDLLRCYDRDGWTEEALALRRAQFARQPSVEGYRAVVAAGASAVRPPDEVRAALMEVVSAAEQQAIDKEADRLARLRIQGRRALSSAPGASRDTPFHPDVTLRASILCAESRWVEAWAAARPPNVCAEAGLKHIARNLPRTHDAEAVRLLRKSFEREMLAATSPYREALALVRDIARRMSPAEWTAWLLGLGVEFKAKRNFIRDLPSFSP